MTGKDLRVMVLFLILFAPHLVYGAPCTILYSLRNKLSGPDMTDPDAAASDVRSLCGNLAECQAHRQSVVLSMAGGTE